MQFVNGNYVPNNNYIPPANPIGNCNNMGGFYTNNYNYYNPFLEQEKKRLEEIKKKEQAREQCDVLKILSTSVHTSFGEEIDREKIENLYNPIFNEPKKDEFVNNYDSLCDLYYNGYQGNPYIDNMIEAKNRIYEYRQTLMPKDCDLYEFSQKSVNLIDEIEKDEQKRQHAEQMANLYNRKDFGKLVNATSRTNGYFDNVFDNNKGNDIDDMEVHFPAYRSDEDLINRERFFNNITETNSAIKTEDTIRRQQFLDEILGQINSRNNNG